MKINFIVGDACAGKSTFIKQHFDKNEYLILDTFEYQGRHVDKIGKYERLSVEGAIKAYEELRDDVARNAAGNKDIVVEHTLFKKKRRDDHIRAIKEQNPDAEINVYIVLPDAKQVAFNFEKRKLSEDVNNYAERMSDMDDYTLESGFNNMYTVKPNKDNWLIEKVDNVNFSEYVKTLKEKISTMRVK